MKNKQKEERSSLELEIKARKELIKRLNHPAELLKVAAKKESDRRSERVNSLREYKTYSEAQEAYGWGIITEEEFYVIAKALEEGDEYIENTRTPTEIANEMLKEFIVRLDKEVRSFEFELLPPEEQERIRKEHEELRARIEARKGGKPCTGTN
jgi:hypothetical protein